MQRLAAVLAGHYRIERELGAGGMALVYLAHDLRHDRRVALKVLRPELAAILGAQRFLAEIKTTANLQHPHILSLFDSGEADGLVFYVMPYVEGESLRDRLKREHQLRVDEAVRIAREVADALEYAHGHGIVHRDIKPENILLHGGHALVADFGIALAAVRSEGGTRLTETGMSLGTPHYMAPEQAMGEKEITPKADVYALGCVLYEMLTGEPPFTGATAQAIIARVMTEQPRPLTLQRRTIPPHVEAAVRVALEKLPADRFESARAFADALANPEFTRPRDEAAGAVAALGRPMVSVGLAAAVVVATAVAAWGWLRSSPRPPVARYATTLRSGNDAPSGTTLRSQAAIAPDGSFIVYRDGPPGGTQLFIKRRDELVAQPLAGTEGGTGPFVSPDGAWIAFFASRELRKVPSRGGGALTLADSVNMTFVTGAWLDNETIVYSDLPQLRRISAAGGASTVIVPPTSILGRASLMPQPLPDRRGVLLTSCSPGCENSAVHVYDARADTTRLLFEGALGAWYAPTGGGYLLHLTVGGTLVASPWDNDALAPSGPGVPVLDGVQAPGFLLAPDGTALYVLGPPVLGSGLVPNAEAVWVDRTGRVEAVDSTWRFNTGGGNWGLDLSPDGSRLAIRLGTALGLDIWVKELPRGTVSRLTFDEGEDRAPYWRPDGQAIVYTSERRAPGDTAQVPSSLNVWEKAADGTGEPRLLWDDSLSISEAFWSPDRQWLVLRTAGIAGAAGGRDILALRPGTDSVVRRLIATAYDEQGPAISPDSRWIAYVSNETGANEVFIRPFPDTDRGKWQVSNGGGNAPVWAHNGREVFYLAGGSLNVVEIRPGPPFSVSQPRALFPRPERVRGGSAIGGRIGITPDDSRFLMIRDVPVGRDSTAVSRLVVVHNFLEELAAKVGR